MYSIIGSEANLIGLKITFRYGIPATIHTGIILDTIQQEGGRLWVEVYNLLTGRGQWVLEADVIAVIGIAGDNMLSAIELQYEWELPAFVTLNSAGFQQEALLLASQKVSAEYTVVTLLNLDTDNITTECESHIAYEIELPVYSYKEV